MAEKKAAKAFVVRTGAGTEAREVPATARSLQLQPSFQAHTSPQVQAPHPRLSGPREAAPNNPVALTPPRRHLALRGMVSPPCRRSDIQCLSFPSAQLGP